MSNHDVFEIAKFVCKSLWYGTVGNISNLDPNLDFQLYGTSILVNNFLQFLHDPNKQLHIFPSTFQIYDDSRLFMLYDMTIDLLGHVSCSYDKWLHYVSSKFNVHTLLCGLDVYCRYDVLVLETRSGFKIVGIISCQKKRKLMEHFLSRDIVNICAMY